MSVEYYAFLLTDRLRIESFLRSIAATVKPGDRVLEVGCGIATYGLAAVRAGAACVDAIDFNPVAIALAREMGVEKQNVRLIEKRVEEVELPERADVVLFEDFSCFGVAPGLRALLAHVQGRLARPGARYIPSAVELLAAPVDAPIDAVGPEDSAWLPFSDEALSLLRKRFLNVPTSRRLEPTHLAGSACVLHRLDLSEPLPKRSVHSATTHAGRTTQATGIAGWMRLELPGGASIETAPGTKFAWGQMFFPFETPLPCRPGEPLEISVETIWGPDSKALLWRWRLHGATGAREGCTLNSLPGGAALLRRGSPEFVPRPSSRKEAVAALCQAVDGTRNLSEIARIVYNKCTPRFSSELEALDFVLDALSCSTGLIEDRP
ncbi:MAG: methyltransferase domain-containing protein [Planctomycetes bacterium]|nr:methyltransferase domain-containing protein [Planctomycetota bacterium]